MTDVPPLGPSGGPAATADRSGWQRYLLIGSLALNLIILGMVGGAAMRNSRGDGGGPVRDLSFGPFTAALLPEDRDALRRSFLAGDGTLLKMRRTARAEFAELFAALRADPYVPEVTAEVMARQADRLTDGIRLGQKLLLERIGQMSPLERLSFADRLEASVRRGPGGADRHDSRD